MPLDKEALASLRRAPAADAAHYTRGTGRRWWWWVAGAAVIVAAVILWRVSSSLPQFPSQVERVTVEVTVLDRSGRPVAGLRQEDFSVFEDGMQQDIAFFAPVEIPGGTPPAAGQPQLEGLRPEACTALSPDWTYVC